MASPTQSATIARRSGRSSSPTIWGSSGAFAHSPQVVSCSASDQGAERGVLGLLEDEAADRFRAAEPQVLIVKIREVKDRGTVRHAGERVGKLEVASGSGQTRTGREVLSQFVDGDATQFHDVSITHSRTLP